jgi:limonene-1,2-epoxide hydrolase
MNNREKSERGGRRRGFVRGLGAAVGAGLLATLAKPGRARADDDDDEGAAAEELVLDFLATFHSPLDVELLLSFLADDIVKQNTGMAPIIGKDAIRAYLTPVAGLFSSQTSETLNIVARGHLVAAERLEFYTLSPTSPVGIPGASATLKTATWFEVHDGLITRWAEHFDSRVFTVGLGFSLGPYVPYSP